MGGAIVHYFEHSTTQFRTGGDSFVAMMRFPLYFRRCVRRKMPDKSEINSDKCPKIGLPLKCFGQQTNSTPENNEMPHGNKMAKLRICMPRSWQAAAPV